MALTKNSFKVDGHAPNEQHQPDNLTIVTSWDDGGEMDMRVADLLTQYQLPGVFYIIVDKVGTEGFLSWSQIKDLDKRGFEIGSHTMTHPADLKACYDDQLHYELVNSKDMLEAVLNKPVTKFCYPRGRHDERVKAKVQEAGYLEGRATKKPGILVNDDPFDVPGTIHIFDRKEYMGKSIIDFAKDTIDRGKKEGGYINIWGHSKEINTHQLWGVLEEVLAYAAKR